jgi:hypothetical protein
MAIKYINILQSTLGLPKFTQIGIFGFENKPSGNPRLDGYRDGSAG